MYVKIFSDILQSTLWEEPADVCKVWITMLTLCHVTGVVRSTAPGIATFSRVPLERTREILALLEAPDPDSRTPDHDGRRIERVDGGYQVLNYNKYRELTSDEQRRKSDRERQRKHREKSVTVTSRNVMSRDVTLYHGKKKEKKKEIYTDPSLRSGSDSAEVSQAKPATPTAPPEKPVDTLLTFPCNGVPNEWHLTQSWLDEMQKFYTGIDCLDVSKRALAWTLTNRKHTAKRMAAWLTGVWFNGNAEREARAPANRARQQANVLDASMMSYLAGVGKQ